MRLKPLLQWIYLMLLAQLYLLLAKSALLSPNRHYHHLSLFLMSPYITVLRKGILANTCFIIASISLVIILPARFCGESFTSSLRYLQYKVDYNTSSRILWGAIYVILKYTSILPDL